MAGTVLARIPKGKDEIRVSLENFRGQDSVHVRLYVKLADPSGDIVATKKGVSLPVANLPDLLTGIQDALAEARRLNLMPKARNAT